MIGSLKRYVRLFVVTVFLRKEKLILWNHCISFFITRSFKKKRFSDHDKFVSLDLAITWLLSAQNSIQDDGFTTYYIVGGWTSSYPETSGYIIPTLHRYAYYHPDRKQEIDTAILTCADWLVNIQKPSGGWQSAYVEHNRPEVVFNTGQVIRGLWVAYEISKNEIYKQSMIKACDWLVQTQEENGSWVKTAYMNKPRVYDSYVAHPLLMVHQLTGKAEYKNAAIKNLDWILTQQHTNGWFSNADNTEKHNDRPILHTIAYTIDGLINSGLLLNKQEYIQAGKKAADKLLLLFSQQKYLSGRYDKLWNASEYIICTGCAQMSIVWSMLFEITGRIEYREAAEKMNDQLTFIQRSCLTIRGKANGAIPGSFPLFGKYEPFGFPNWATKYYADAIMAEIQPNQ